MICLADAMAHLKGETFLEEACHCRQALGVKGLLHFQLATKDASSASCSGGLRPSLPLNYGLRLQIRCLVYDILSQQHKDNQSDSIYRKGVKISQG